MKSPGNLCWGRIPVHMLPTSSQHDQARRIFSRKLNPSDCQTSFYGCLHSHQPTPLTSTFCARPSSFLTTTLLQQDIARKLETITDGGDGDGHREPEPNPAPPALPAVTSGNLSVVDCGLFPESFLSYLSELENDFLFARKRAKLHDGRCGEICRGRRPSPPEPREM